MRAVRALPLALAAALGGEVACAQIAGLTDYEPYPPPPPNEIVQVSAGASHACALTRGGAVWCWGDNATGQLGHRTVDGGTCTTACAAGEVLGVSGAVHVSAGDGFTCAVLAKGEVSCWGSDASGELGRSTSNMCENLMACDPVPDPVLGVSGAVQVSAGSTYACARTGAGAVVCWGANAYGQLGTGDLVKPAAPKLVNGIGEAIDVSTSLLGPSTCAATSDGKVYCWGLNVYGATGHAPGTGDVMSADMHPCSPSPVAVAGPSGATSAVTGDYAACAAVAGGEFKCWGYDGLGCLGNGSNPAAASSLVELPPALISVVPKLSSLSLRYTHACGLDAHGTAWCWGQSGIGALGPEHAAGAPCDQKVLCQSEAQNTGLGSVTAIATGTALTVALRADGTVWAWGENDAGQLGHAPATLGDGLCLANPTSLCNATPSEVQGLPH